jgi:tRNA-dihydrouridine synthase 3
VLPQKINERPPPHFCRNDLETLMASNDSADWVKISNMLLGPPPKQFEFVAKHKSNSYNSNAVEEVEG